MCRSTVLSLLLQLVFPSWSNAKLKQTWPEDLKWSISTSEDSWNLNFGSMTLNQNTKYHLAKCLLTVNILQRTPSKKFYDICLRCKSDKDLPYFIEYSAHFFSLKMMLNYYVPTILGRCHSPTLFISKVFKQNCKMKVSTILSCTLYSIKDRICDMLYFFLFFALMGPVL